MVWNEERANLSVRIRIEGKAILPPNNFKITEVATYKYRTFSLVKDGIVNVEKLPVSYSENLWKILTDNNVKYYMPVDKETFKLKGYIIIDLTSLPIINGGMVRALSAQDLAIQEWELIKLQADKKVYDYYRKALYPKESKSFIELVGQECADWLKTIGITDYNGYAPLVDLEESTDFYMSVNLITKIKGLSSLAKVEDVIAKVKSGATMKPGEAIMADAVKKYFAVLDSELYTASSEELRKEVLKGYLLAKTADLNKKKRKAMQEIAEIKFALILSKKWFKEFKSFDENTLVVKLDGQDVNFTFDLCEKEVKI